MDFDRRNFAIAPTYLPGSTSRSMVWKQLFKNIEALHYVYIISFFALAFGIAAHTVKTLSKGRGLDVRRVTFPGNGGRRDFDGFRADVDGRGFRAASSTAEGSLNINSENLFFYLLVSYYWFGSGSFRHWCGNAGSGGAPWTR